MCCASRLGRVMTEPSLAELEARRRVLFERLAQVGDLGRGRGSGNERRSAGGMPLGACAARGRPCHGPGCVWRRTTVGRRTRGRQLDRAEVDKVRGELARYQQFAKITDDIVEVNEAICEARPVGAVATVV